MFQQTKIFACSVFFCIYSEGQWGPVFLKHDSFILMMTEFSFLGEVLLLTYLQTYHF